MIDIFNGGESAQESIRNGVMSISADEDDVIIIHDGVRPLVDDSVLSDVIIKCKEFGNAVTNKNPVQMLPAYINNNNSEMFIPNRQKKS